MVSPAEEKRQEEKRIKELRDFQRSSPANRRCFDCNEMMPQYVCLDFNTFVCTACSGIHREFSHRVKSISASKFTESEVKTLVKLGGNEAAQKYWRAKHDPNFRPSGGNEGDRTRNFIRLTYIDRKWVYESPRESKKEDTKRTSSGNSRNKSSFTSSDGNDFFSSSSKKKVAAPAPTFDAFGSSTDTSSSGGFAQFGDFSSFGNEPAKASAEFADFGNFDSASSGSNAATDNGFGDFGDFEGSRKSSLGLVAAPTPAPAVRSDFGSFKLAPPPGSSFSSSSSSSAAVPAAATPPAKQAPSDFMAFSPDKVVKDPFGFDEPPAAKTTSHPPASPFDAFGSPAPASTGSRGSSSSFDAFGSTPAPAPAAPSVFDAFGSPATTPATTPFDAFGAAPSSSASSFDAFGAPPAAPASQPFDAFGGSSASASTSGFGDFSSATPARSSSGTFPSTNVADPFDAFSPRVSSRTNKTPEPAKPEPVFAADPFAAFDGMDTSAPPAAFGAGSSSTGSFGGGSSSNNVFGSSSSIQSGGAVAGLGFAGSNVSAHAPSNDPFAFTGTGGGSKSNSFSNPGAGAPPHQPNGATSPFSQGFPGAGANPYQQHQQHPQQNANQMYNPMFMQQPNTQQQGYQQHPQQQQWYGHLQQQQYPGQQQHMQPPGQFPSHPPAANGGIPSTIPVHTKPTTAETLAINDPFAALNIGLGSTSSNQAATNSRGNSFEQKKPSSASGSFSNGQPGAPSPFQPHQTPAGNAFGGGFPVAAGGSRGNSFESLSTPAFGAPMSTASPMSSFSYPPPQAAAFPGPSQSPMSSFSTLGQNTSQHNSFTDNAFGAFTSAPRADSLKGPSSSAAPANPFDMF